ncbi:hypothetical protein GCM10022420_008480 [Streptomyces iranensis]
MRNGPHTDLGTFTLLSRQQGVGGLQAWNEADGWFAPPYNPDAIGCIRREADSGEPVVLDLVPFEPGGQVGVEIIPDHHDRAVELDVRADQQIPVVLPPRRPRARHGASAPPTAHSPQTLRDHSGLLTRSEPFRSLKPDPLTKSRGSAVRPPPSG